MAEQQRPVRRRVALKVIKAGMDTKQVVARFEAEDPDKARLVKLRYFAGLSVREAADALGISPATAKRHWVYARSWLYGRLHGR